MAEFEFERDARTAHSEVYRIEQEGEPVGRVDVHFTESSVAVATLCVPPHFDEDDIQTLIGEIDERLVMSANPDREDFVVTVWRGEQAGIYSEEDMEDEEGEERENGFGPS